MTPLFLTIWMLSSFLVFTVITLVYKEDMQTSRGFNTWCVLGAQGLGALVAYAIH